MSSISGALPSSPSVTAASPVANEDRSGENGDNDVSVKKKKKSSRKGRQPAKKRDGHNKKRSAKHKLVLQTLMVAIHNHGEQLGVTMQTYQLNPRVTRKKRKKYRKKWYRRGKHSHRKLLTKLIQNDPLMRVLWPLYSFIKTLFRKRKRKRKYLCNVQSSSSSLHGVIGKPFMPETVTPYGENALFRGETMPVRDKPQAGNPPEDSKNPADSGIATTSDTSGELKRKAEPQPDTSALATGSSSQHHHEDQIFTHPSSHGAHQIPPDSMLLIPSSHDDRIPLETELPPSHSCMFSEKEEFKQAASTFECCLGDERTWDDGLPPGPLDTKFNPPQPSASAVEFSNVGHDADHQLLNGQSICQQPLPDHHGGPSAMIVPPLPVLPSLHPQFQEVPTEAAILLPVAPDEPYLVYSGGTLSNTEERVSLPYPFKTFPYLMEIL